MTPNWTQAEWAEWSNELAELIPDDLACGDPEGAQESIIADTLAHLVRCVLITTPEPDAGDVEALMSATDHTLTDAERAMFERIEDTGDTQGLTWRVQELVTEARALADEESASRVALANQLVAAEAEKEALRAERDRWKVLAEHLRGASQRAESAEDRADSIEQARP